MHSQSGLLSNRTKLIVIYSDHLQKSCLMLGCFSIDASMVQLRLTVTWQKESLMLLSRRSRNFLHHGLVVYSKMLLQRNPFCIRACASRILDNWSRATWNLEMGYFLGFEFSPCHASFDVILFRQMTPKGGKALVLQFQQTKSISPAKAATSSGSIQMIQSFHHCSVLFLWNHQGRSCKLGLQLEIMCILEHTRDKTAIAHVSHVQTRPCDLKAI